MQRLNLVPNEQTHNHSLMVGKNIVYCMDCGQIVIIFKNSQNKKDFKKLMSDPLNEVLDND